jgi:hypothetical protein
MPDMLRTLGLLFLALIASAGVALGFWYHQDQQARQFVTAVTPLIYKTWNVEALTHRSASVLRTPDYEAEVRDVFKIISPHLGPIESATAPEGTLRFGRADRQLPRGLYGKYKSTAKFHDAEATLEFLVIKERGVWRIASFQVGSPAILQGLGKHKSAKAAEHTWVKGPADEEAAVLAEVEEIFRRMDSEDPGATWHRGSLLFQEATPKRRFVADLKRLREKAGHVQNRKLQGVGFQFDMPSGRPPGDYAVADFESIYSRATLQERLGFYKHEGKWRFSRYQWKSVDTSR